LNQYIRRLLRVVAAIAAIAAAVVVVVMAAALTLYAVAKPYLGEAGAAGTVAGVFALIAVIVAWIVSRKAAPPEKTKAHKNEDASVVDRLIVMAKERPLIALGATAAAAVVLLRNPAVITAVVSAFVAGNASKK
jgi:hypothetical protein